MTFNLKNEKPVTGDVAGVYFVKNSTTPADNGIYVINVNGQAPIRMATAVNMDDYITAAIIASTYVALAGNQTITGNKTFTGELSILTKALTENSTYAASTAFVQTLLLSQYGQNTVVGSGALPTKNAETNSIGGNNFGNIVLGYLGLANNTTGKQNVALGWGVMRYNTTGIANIALGADSMESTVANANSNIAIGNEALRQLSANSETSLYNIAIGQLAGKLTNGDSNGLNKSNDSIFIGRETKSKAENSINEIVIGKTAVGKGDNTVTLGNDSIVETWLKGKVFANKIASTTANSTFIPNFSTSVYNDVPGVSYIESNDVDTNLNEFNVGDVVTVLDSNDEPVFQTTIASVVIHGLGQYQATLTDDPTALYQQDVNGVYIQISRASANINIPTLDLEFGNTFKPSIASDSQKSLLNANLQPRYNSTYNLGGASNLWKEVFSSSAAINTSDARLKTEIVPFTQDELNASKQLSKEVGTYKFLSAIAEKGDAARKHIGMTVQRAIEIMTANNLNPFNYGFICYDSWQNEYRKVIDVHAEDYRPAYSEEIGIDEKGNPIIVNHPEVPAIEEVSHQEQIKVTGDIYSFRYTELLAFICRGFEERITALENV